MSAPTPPPKDGGKSDAKAAEANVPLLARLGGGLISWLLASKIRLGGVFTLLIVALSGAWYVVNRQPPPTPAERLVQALEALDEDPNRISREVARKLAKQIQDLGERDPEFAGGAEFVLGMAQFRDAEEAGETTREAKYLASIKLLRDAEHRGIAPEREPEWLFAVGTSLYRVGSVSAARPLLEQAIAVCEEGRDEVMSLLVDTYLDLKTPQDLERALVLTGQLLAMPLSAEKKDRALMQRAQIQMAIGQSAEAQATLKEVSEESWNLGTRLFNAQTRMARQEYREALKDLERVASDGGLDRTFPRQASYLMGLCAEKQGDVDTAITQFERTASQFERSHEALASKIRAADLLCRIGRNEEALNRFKGVLREIRNPDDFRNRLMSIDEVRRVVLGAWASWVAAKDYSDAIELARAMPPLMSVAEAKELEARAQQTWAETLEAESSAARWSERQSLRPKLLERWRKSAAAYAELADMQRALKVYPDTLWLSAEHFSRGRDYARAIEQIDAFIETRPKRLLPLALLRRGQALKDLDRQEEALTIFRTIVREHPTDPSVFEAQYLIGLCHLECGRQEAAEKAWRGVLASDELSPAAQQWRLSLFELGRLLYHSACARAGQALPEVTADALADSASKTPPEAYGQWDDSSQRLDEFVRRYPDDLHCDEARFLLAKSLQYGAGQHRDRLRTAETENSRHELKRQLHAQLELALQQLQTLRTALLEQAEGTGLDPMRRQILRNACFEIAGVWYAMEQYEKAIIAYSGATNRYPEDPHVLLSYLQMAQCYERLGKNVEARSMLQQARVIFSGMRPTTFESHDSSLSRDDWNQWLTWAARLRDPGSATAAGVKP